LTVLPCVNRFQLPELLPFLNRLHYVVREEVVSGLIKKTNDDCDVCRSRAALQLALCRSISFGNFHDNDSFARDLARVLQFQGKHIEGIEILQSIPGVLSKLPIKKRSGVFASKVKNTKTFRYKENWRLMLKSKMLLTNMLIREDRLEDAINVGIVEASKQRDKDWKQSKKNKTKI